MSKIIGVTVGTPLSPSRLADKIKPVTSVNGVKPDENGNVEITATGSGSNADLTGYATEQYVKDYAQPKGNYAMKSEIPSVPVQSVNGKTGNVVLDASAVGARPDNWMPTYSDVGADKSGTASFQVAVHNNSTTSHEDIRQELKDINDRLDEVPSGGGGAEMEKIIDFTLEEEVSELTISTDLNGNPFELSEFVVWFKNAVVTKGSYPHWVIEGLPNMNRGADTYFASWGCYCKIRPDGTMFAFEGDQSNLPYSDARLFPIVGLASSSPDGSTGTMYTPFDKFKLSSFGQNFAVGTRLIVYGVRV